MNDPIRFTKLPSIADFQETAASDKPASETSQQTQIQGGIASAKDSFESWQQNSLFTFDQTVNEISSPNVTDLMKNVNGLLMESKEEIFSFLKGDPPSESAAKEPFSAMKDFLMLTQNELREESPANNLSLLSKENKLSLDNQKIDQQMKEAGEKADIAMDQATASMVMGIVSGGLSIAGAADQLQSLATISKGDLLQNTSDLRIESRFQSFTSHLNDLVKVDGSDRHSQQANKADIHAKQLENAANTDDETSKSSVSHRDRMRDAILDFIRKMSEMNPKI